MGGSIIMDRETKLLFNALMYEDGHKRRTQHILKVYALSKVIGENIGLTERELDILKASAILHDIAIKYCKEKYNGDCSQENQIKEVPKMVREFMESVGYPNDYIEEAIYLVKNHHCYTIEFSPMLQALIEADLIINFYESSKDKESIESYSNLFKSDAGKSMLENIKNTL